jgi:hypothetical protein
MKPSSKIKTPMVDFQFSKHFNNMEKNRLWAKYCNYRTRTKEKITFEQYLTKNQK